MCTERTEEPPITMRKTETDQLMIKDFVQIISFHVFFHDLVNVFFLVLGFFVFVRHTQLMKRIERLSERVFFLKSYDAL